MSPGSRAAAEPDVRPRGRRPAHRRSGHRRQRSTAHRAWRDANRGRSRSAPALPSRTVVAGPDGPELHARGAIDDKGNVAFHLLGMRAHLAATGRDTPAVTVKLLIEGEEESGSPHFAELLRKRADRLACDVVVVSDT